ncbi:MAG: DUF302 domain-containing protein [Gemmatirosa sp.]|nr:DUF302 domain-containing protein [Gemmatirosa sp.]
MVSLRSPHAAPEVLDRLAALAVARGLMVFGRIEFSRDAASVGLELPPMAQLIFGHPRGGTPVLRAAPLTGLQLPLRALAWTDTDGQAWLSYPDPDALRRQHQLPDAVTAGLHVVHELCRAAVGFTRTIATGDSATGGPTVTLGAPR